MSAEQVGGEPPHPLYYPSPNLEDELVLLRPWKYPDVQMRLNASRDAEIAKFTWLNADMDTPEAYGWYNGLKLELEAGKSLHLVIEEKKTNSAVGSIGLFNFNWRHKRAEVGYWIMPEGRNKNLMTSSLILLNEWAFRKLRLNRIEIFTNTDNYASMKVAEKAGFVKEGVLHKYVEGKRGVMDIVVLGKTI